jgi:hypothetical protein
MDATLQLITGQLNKVGAGQEELKNNERAVQEKIDNISDICGELKHINKRRT